jgi:hypothetical protein
VITSTHALLALAALSKRGERKRNLSVFTGSLLPDLAIFLWAPYQSIVHGVSGDEMWNELYFAPPMQNLIAWFNSIPIYAGLLLIGLVARSKTWGKLLVVFALAALIHIATDMPVHADDAYRHFWPISDWRFYSPFSYWDVEHHAAWVGKLDIFIALACIAVLWRRFPSRWVKIVLSVTAIPYILLLVGSVFLG